jgi:hypothetical protein
MTLVEDCPEPPGWSGALPDQALPEPPDWLDSPDQPDEPDDLDSVQWLPAVYGQGLPLPPDPWPDWGSSTAA